MARTKQSLKKTSNTNKNGGLIIKKDDIKFDYEFGGPIGALSTTIFLPIVTLLLTYWASLGYVGFEESLSTCTTAENDGSISSMLYKYIYYTSTDDSSTCASSKSVIWEQLKVVLCPSYTDHSTLITCALVILSWFIFQVILERALPCTLIDGAPLPDGSGKRLSYRINGHLSFWVTLLLLDVAWPEWTDIIETPSDGSINATKSVLVFGRAPLTWLYDHYSTLAFVTILWTILLSTYLYIKSFQKGLLLAVGGNSGNHFYDYFLGRELNPRWGSFDWKEFCELRPGLVGWMLLNIGMMSKQYEKLGYVTGSMILINIFQGLYVWDAQFQERAILTTMDITTDGFGFMLVFGDLAWVPFTYSLQARYLVDHDPLLQWPALLAIVGVNVVGYLIFRGANGQKDAFRRDPNASEVSHLTFLQTKRGTKLLTSGWWGMARKVSRS